MIRKYGHPMGEYWYCVKDHRVEQPPEMCPPIDRLGPYDTEADAQRALGKAAERNAQWEADDRDWNGED